jgi:hypothetical protein
LTIAATDGGARVATTTVDIEVMDVNDNAPIFSNTPYTANVTESEVQGSGVFLIQATDADKAENKVIKYAIESGNEGDAFAINEDSGEITVAGDIDRETISSYTLTISATDGATTDLSAWPMQSTTTTIVITVIDLNDETPTFASSTPDIVRCSFFGRIVHSRMPLVPTHVRLKRTGVWALAFLSGVNCLLPVGTINLAETLKVSIKEDASNSDIIFEFIATDNDIGNNALISFEIIGGNTDGKFAFAKDSNGA